MATNWDKTKPAATDKLRTSDDDLRNNAAALEDAIGRNHNFPGNESSDAGEHTVVELQDQAGDPATPASVIGLYNNADSLYFRKASSGTVTEIISPIPSGTKMLFAQSSAPTGWTFVSENNDRVLVNQSTVGNGGTTGGSWTISGITVDGHQLTIAEIPAHTHAYAQASAAVGTGSAFDQVRSGTGLDTSSTGGDGTHNHNLTIGSSWRPQWLGVISCTKD